MNSRPDVAKLMQIALCFAGVVIVVSGLGFGLTRLANRTLFYGNAGTGKLLLYLAGMMLYCPLAFGEAVIGLGCIRYNKRLAGFFEKYARKPSRIGRSAWKFSEIHALCCVFFGMFILFVGTSDVINTTRLLIDMLCFTRHYDNVLRTILFWIAALGPIALIVYLLPGVLLIRFAQRLTGVIGKKIVRSRMVGFDMTNEDKFDPRCICRCCGWSFGDYFPWGEDSYDPSFAICDCCGCEAGNEDSAPESLERYRQNWLDTGAKWYDSKTKPVDWDDGRQLKEQLERVNRMTW